MKLLSVVGARPQFVKAAALSRAVEAYNATTGEARAIHEVLVHTGQHYDYEMSAVFFKELCLATPDYHLGVGSCSHGTQTGRMLQEIEQVLVKEAPDVVLVYGDTNSTLSGALAGAKLQIPVAHVEAGLRSYNRQMPEELNRVVTDHVSLWLFCPTDTAVRNLFREGIVAGVRLVGDVMYEMIQDHAATAAPAQLVPRLGLCEREFALATVHRAENTDVAERLIAIFEALACVSRRLPVICPLHPRTRAALGALSHHLPPSLHLVEPVGYLEMLALERDARLVLTDSGGVQKEAYWLGVPCIALRDETEWVETLEEGRNVLTGADAGRILLAAQELLQRPRFAPPVVKPIRAAETIVRELSAISP